MKCYFCGVEWPDHSMYPINAGRGTHHICPKCYETGQRECRQHTAELFNSDVGRRILGEAAKKKRGGK